MSLLAATRDDLDRQFHPAGFIVGINNSAPVEFKQRLSEIINPRNDLLVDFPYQLRLWEDGGIEPLGFSGPIDS